MKNESELDAIAKGFYNDIHKLVVKNGICKQVWLSDRMRPYKRSCLRLTTDLFRLMLSVVMVARRKGNDKVIAELRTLWIEWFDQLTNRSNEQIEQLIDEHVRKTMER